MTTFDLLHTLTLDTEVYYNGMLYTNPLAANRLLSSAELNAEILSLEIRSAHTVHITTKKGGLYGSKAKS